MIRIIGCIFVYLLFLGAASLRASWTDGLEVTLIGWVEVLQRRRIRRHITKMGEENEC